MKTLIFFLTVCSLAYGIDDIFDQVASQEFDWCTPDVNDTMLGDFNGDNRDDILCVGRCMPRKRISWSRSPYGYEGVDWEIDYTMSFCDGAEQSQDTDFLVIGDFNGDNRDDLLCHNFESGLTKQLFALKNGTIEDRLRFVYHLDFCIGLHMELYTGDFNGDQQDDLLCHDEGNVWLLKPNEYGVFEGETIWHFVLQWCRRDVEKLYIGKFNDDKRDDMLCHDKKNGEARIMIAREDGFFEKEYRASEKFCSRKDQLLYIADFNADGRDDLLCHGLHTGYIWISYANPDGKFGTDKWEGDLDFCKGFQMFNVANLDGDNIADLMCRTRSEPVADGELPEYRMNMRMTSAKMAAPREEH